MLDIQKLKLWPHQRKAVKHIEKYFEAAGTLSALIHHPTGAGKTGIMATLARRRAASAPILVICPSAALVVQLEQQFRSAFWAKIKASTEWYFRHTVRMTLAQLDDVLETLTRAGGEEVAVFATIQALQQIYVSPRYRELVGRFGTVFFDEGHREPAPQWARAARGLKVPTVLFSATPYRNDLKIFGVNQEYISFLSFKQAADKGLIRPVEIIEQQLPRQALAFARHVIELRDDLFARRKIKAAHKMIVRADEESEVEALFVAFKSLLKGREDGVLAIHHNFKEGGLPGAQKRGDVPDDLSERSEHFLIHQHMLTEGIDDPSCTTLALFSPFTNERQLVQQVGRLTRHPGPLGTRALPARVYARAGDQVANMWRRFLDYDVACVENGGRPPMRDETFVERILSALPELDYVEGRFRRRANLSDEVIRAEIRVPLSAVVFEVSRDFNLNAFAEAISVALDEEDRIEQAAGVTEDPGCRYHLSISLRQSPHLAESLFQVASLEVTVYAHRGNRLYFYDSRGLWIDEIENLSQRIGPRALGTLLPETSQAVTAITLRNTDLGPLALRGRSLQAPSLARAGVFIGEQTHVVSRATGRPSDGVRRTLGFTSARVRQGEGPNATLHEFSDWCDQVGAELDMAAAPAALFGRFATSINTPTDTTPRNILIDFSAYVDNFRDEDSEPVKFDLESACSDIREKEGGPVSYRHSFEIIINSTHIEVWIRWDSKKQKFWLASPDLSRFHDRNNEKITLLHRLNRQQPFRIIINASVVYAYGKFYSIELELGKPNGPAALVVGLLHGVPGLHAIVSEKGNLARAAATWPANSLFGFIDRGLAAGATQRPFGPPFQALVCDDLGEEAADFIGIDNNAVQRVVFIAAKWKHGAPGAGASGLYDVSGQALKNLAYLKADGQRLPGAEGKFDNRWEFEDGSVRRRRLGPKSKDFRILFQTVRVNPAASREVWLVLGGGILSKRAVERELRATVPSAHVLQLFHLLLSIYAGCQSIGVDLKIFCAE